MDQVLAVPGKDIALCLVVVKDDDLGAREEQALLYGSEVAGAQVCENRQAVLLICESLHLLLAQLLDDRESKSFPLPCQGDGDYGGGRYAVSVIMGNDPYVSLEIPYRDSGLPRLGYEKIQLSCHFTPLCNCLARRRLRTPSIHNSKGTGQIQFSSAPLNYAESKAD